MKKTQEMAEIEKYDDYKNDKISGIQLVWSCRLDERHKVGPQAQSSVWGWSEGPIQRTELCHHTSRTPHRSGNLAKE